MIITATLITVAAMESRIMKREKDFCWLNAILRAINEEMFTIKYYSPFVSIEPNAGNLRLEWERFLPYFILAGTAGSWYFQIKGTGSIQPGQK